MKRHYKVMIKVCKYLFFVMDETDIMRYCDYIYFIAENAPSDQGTPVKVGSTGSLIRRLLELQTGNWRPLVVLISVRVPKTYALRIEHALQRRISDRRILNEWFLLSMTDVQTLASWIRNEYVLHEPPHPNLVTECSYCHFGLDQRVHASHAAICLARPK